MKITPANFLFALSKIRQQQFAFLEAALAAHGVRDISPSYGDVLFALDRRGPLSLQEIARLTMKDKSTVSSVIKRLEAGGYVAKQRRKDDARSLAIGLTKKADWLRPLVWQISDAMNAELYRGLSDREKETLFRLIGKVYANSLAGAGEREPAG